MFTQPTSTAPPRVQYLVAGDNQDTNAKVGEPFTAKAGSNPSSNPSSGVTSPGGPSVVPMHNNIATVTTSSSSHPNAGSKLDTVPGASMPPPSHSPPHPHSGMGPGPHSIMPSTPKASNVPATQPTSQLPQQFSVPQPTTHSHQPQQQQAVFLAQPNTQPSSTVHHPVMQQQQHVSAPPPPPPQYDQHMAQSQQQQHQQAAMGGPKKVLTQQHEERMRDRHCFHCSSKDHLYRDCPIRLQSQQPQVQTQAQPQQQQPHVAPATVNTAAGYATVPQQPQVFSVAGQAQQVMAAPTSTVPMQQTMVPVQQQQQLPAYPNTNSAMHPTMTSKSASKKRQGPPEKCWTCNKFGHFSRDCPNNVVLRPRQQQQQHQQLPVTSQPSPVQVVPGAPSSQQPQQYQQYPHGAPVTQVQQQQQPAPTMTMAQPRLLQLADGSFVNAITLDTGMVPAPMTSIAPQQQQQHQQQQSYGVTPQQHYRHPQHNSSQPPAPPAPSSPPQCYCCGEKGHIARNCPRGVGGGKLHNNTGGSGGINYCFACGKTGHYAKQCPSSAVSSARQSGGLPAAAAASSSVIPPSAQPSLPVVQGLEMHPSQSLLQSPPAVAPEHLSAQPSILESAASSNQNVGSFIVTSSSSSDVPQPGATSHPSTMPPSPTRDFGGPLLGGHDEADLEVVQQLQSNLMQQEELPSRQHQDPMAKVSGTSSPITHSPRRVSGTEPLDPHVSSIL